MLPGQVDLKPLLHTLLDRPGWAPSSPFEVLPEKGGQLFLGLLACFWSNGQKCAEKFKIDGGGLKYSKVVQNPKMIQNSKLAQKVKSDTKSRHHLSGPCNVRSNAVHVERRGGGQS